MQLDRLGTAHASVGEQQGNQVKDEMAQPAAMPLVMGTMAQWDYCRGLLQDLFEARRLSLKVAFEASSTMGTLSILGLVAAGLGATIYPAGIRRLQPDGIIIIDIEDCDILVQTVVAWQRGDVSAAHPQLPWCLRRKPLSRPCLPPADAAAQLWDPVSGLAAVRLLEQANFKALRAARS